MRCEPIVKDVGFGAQNSGLDVVAHTNHARGFGARNSDLDGLGFRV